MNHSAIHGAILRLGTYLFLFFITLTVVAMLVNPLSNLMVASCVATFAGAFVANILTLKIFEQGTLTDIGLGWTAPSGRNLLIGLIGGIGAAGIVLIGPLIVGAAELVPDPVHPANPPAVAFLLFLLLLGASGEELLFRGYAFQITMQRLGVYATVVPVGMLFGIAHISNQSSNGFSIFNTVLWGILLGYAYVRSGDLWLPIGLHFGWNAMLPLFGVNLSGFTMGVTGYVMHYKVSGVWSGEGYGPEAGLLTLLVLPALGYYLHRAPVLRQPANLVPRLSEE